MKREPFQLIRTELQIHEISVSDVVLCHGALSGLTSSLQKQNQTQCQRNDSTLSRSQSRWCLGLSVASQYMQYYMLHIQEIDLHKEYFLDIFSMCVCVCAPRHVHSVLSDSETPTGDSPTRLLCQWHFAGQTTGVGCHFLFQGVFPPQGSNSCLLRLLHQQVDALPLSHLGSSIFSIISENCATFCFLEITRRCSLPS